MPAVAASVCGSGVESDVPHAESKTTKLVVIVMRRIATNTPPHPRLHVSIITLNRNTTKDARLSNHTNPRKSRADVENAGSLHLASSGAGAHPQAVTSA